MQAINVKEEGDANRRVELRVRPFGLDHAFRSLIRFSPTDSHSTVPRTSLGPCTRKIGSRGSSRGPAGLGEAGRPDPGPSGFQFWSGARYDLDFLISL